MPRERPGDKFGTSQGHPGRPCRFMWKFTFKGRNVRGTDGTDDGTEGTCPRDRRDKNQGVSRQNSLCLLVFFFPHKWPAKTFRCRNFVRVRAPYSQTPWVNPVTGWAWKFSRDSGFQLRQFPWGNQLIAVLAASFTKHMLLMSSKLGSPKPDWITPFLKHYIHILILLTWLAFELHFSYITVSPGS